MTTDLVVRRDTVELAGSIWSPTAPTALVLMLPGSGASDRDNHGHFPPIRDRLVSDGYTVAAFDKRGVGASTGRWTDAPIDVQAADAVACLAALRSRFAGLPAGVFGHSQGGWVAVEVAARSDWAAFAVISSGPGVSPAEQERFSTSNRLVSEGWAPLDVRSAMRAYDVLYAALRSGAGRDEGRTAIRSVGAEALLTRMADAGVFVPTDGALWHLTAAILDHDPAPALRQIAVPLLAVFGGADDMVPVERSVAVYRQCVRSDRLDVETYPYADHTIRVGGACAPGLLDRVSRFINRASRGQDRP